MTVDPESLYNAARYRPLGLITNPFAQSETTTSNVATDLEIASESNALLRAIAESSAEEKAKPILVMKTELPSFYATRAVGRMQRSLAIDDSLDLLHSYIQLYMMRVGRIRATLGVVGERLAFRSFDKTLELYLEGLLGEPDESLISYQVLGAERLSAFVERFDADKAAATEGLFGPFVVERRPELAEVADLRLTNLELDVDESQTPAELDSTVGDAPGTDVVLAEEADATEIDDTDQALVDYIVEYTKVHLSPVIARALRVCRERGLAAMATEFKVTKAPRKTLQALVKLASVRFTKVIFMFDGFEGWAQAPDELRTQIAASLAELRWMFESDGMLVLILEEGVVPELEEQYGSSRRVDWAFPGLATIEQAPDSLNATVVDRWIANATLSGFEPMTLGDPVLTGLAEASDGSMALFVAKASAAIEDAAERGSDKLDEAALAAGLAAELAVAEA